MSASTKQGKNWKLVNDGTRTRVYFFGVHGMPVNATMASVSWVANGLIAESINATFIDTRIQELINDDIVNGNGDKIRQLQVSPEDAVVLYLLDIITEQHLQDAKEGDFFIDLPNVNIPDKNVPGGRVLTVRVREDFDQFELATADANGVIIP
jgi:hypothetical protein